MALEITVAGCCKVGSHPDTISVSVAGEIQEQLASAGIPDVAGFLQQTIDAFWATYETGDLDSLKPESKYTELYIEKIYDVRVEGDLVVVMFSPRCVGGVTKGPRCGDCGGEYNVQTKEFEFVEE
ncbi:unnamed protein product [Symbiodinium natans]|uniref:Uncharacterized protein n=1 Tax=Symbiodinium natans TaxID=878477 RepID=A0A812NNE1_9DINO|nr:unnamed protein product [Symbiodinium natans]